MYRRKVCPGNKVILGTCALKQIPKSPVVLTRKKGGKGRGGGRGGGGGSHKNNHFCWHLRSKLNPEHLLWFWEEKKKEEGGGGGGGGGGIKATIFRATDRWILKKTVKHMAVSEQYT